jgi:large subunit ribosomal protein L22
MLYTHVQRNVGHTPRKLRLIVDMVKKMEPGEAIEVLSFTNKLAAPTLAKAIKTALANAGKKDSLRFAKIEINEGLKMRRIAGTGGRGRPRFIKRRLSHIKIVLTDEAKKGDQSGTKN